jgi:hypothetical protein
MAYFNAIIYELSGKRSLRFVYIFSTSLHTLYTTLVYLYSPVTIQNSNPYLNSAQFTFTI